ncbi:MAG TPA: zf-HC2 domain-containing protein [Bryobacteraceae bacterium]|jgi:hypothetical protein|nr:zf-HC2 domain-containing protein [Bryobacteraceae bacterium]
MNKPMHPDNSVLIRHLDGELAGEEWVRVDTHLACCPECRARQLEFRDLSSGIEAALRAVPARASAAERVQLGEKLAEAPRSASSSVIVLRRFGWGMALAAGLALAVLLAPLTSKAPRTKTVADTQRALAAVSSGININGETFIALPYSDPALPLNASRIVEMQVPVSALAEAGVAVQPSWNGNGDGTVAANVLLGIDGQPLGIDVLGAD